MSKKYDQQYFEWLNTPQFCSCGCGKLLKKAKISYEVFRTAWVRYNRGPNFIHTHHTNMYVHKRGGLNARPLPQDCSPNKGKGERNVNCNHYSAGLEYVLVQGWENWHCGGPGCRFCV